jgi:putative intracellular protease/amidase
MNAKKYLRIFSMALAAMFIVLNVNAANILAVTPVVKKVYVCLPCDCGNDDTIYEQPGACSACSMPLIEKNGATDNQTPQSPQPPRKKVAILIFNGVQIIDYTGPFEVFGQAGLDVFTVSTSTNPITTSMGMKVIPKFSLEDAPQADVLLIPGGEVTATHGNPAIIKWIQGQSKDAEHVVSVCNGAFILAKTGLLDGLSATTFYGLIDSFVPFAPKTKVVRDQRYVDNGKFITTAGLSSGIDGSLYVVSKMLGKARAQMVALNMEYNWRADSSYARASFADRHLQKLFSRGLGFATPQGVTLKVLNTEGNYDKWEINWQAQGETTVQEVAKLLHEKLAGAANWTKQNEKITRETAQSVWKFTGEKGEVWNAFAAIKSVDKANNQLLITMKINNNRKPEVLSSASVKTKRQITEARRLSLQ